MIKKRKHVLKYLLIALVFVILVAFIIYQIENKYVLDIINILSLSTGFVSFFISIYIIQYTDDIRKEIRIESNAEKAKSILEENFAENYQSNIGVINKFNGVLHSNQNDKLVILKNDLLIFLNTYELLLQENSEGLFDFEKYVSRLEANDFGNQIKKGRNIVFFRKETTRLNIVVEIIFKKLRGND